MIKITGSDGETASDYFNFLVDAQIIIPATAINIIGDDYLQRLLAHPEISPSLFQQNLEAFYHELDTVTARSVNQLTSISEQLANLVPEVMSEKIKPLFYAGLEKKAGRKAIWNVSLMTLCVRTAVSSAINSWRWLNYFFLISSIISRHFFACIVIRFPLKKNT